MPPRRRDRRNNPPSGHPPGSDRPGRDSPSRSPPTASTRRFPSSTPLLVFSLAFFLVTGSLTVYRGSRRSPAPAALPALSVYERGLVKPDVSFQEILAEHGRVSENKSGRHFPNPVLAYITPWNSKGYEMAKLFSSKLTHLSPVWYELKSEGNKLALEGRHNVDVKWISEIRMNGHSLVLPRVVLEAFPAELLLKKKQWTKAIDVIVTECKDMGYDGIVLESWSRWAAYGILLDPDMRSKALQFIKQLGEALHSVNSISDAAHRLELVYVISPPYSEKLGEYDFGPQDLEELGDVVDGFSLMTYDFSGPERPGPNAPMSWIRSSLHMLLGDSKSGAHACKIFLGINFYGNDFILSEGSGGGAITGRCYISLLEKHQPVLRWEDKSAEHFFIYSHNNARHAVFYPSLMSISVRLDEARDWGAGLSIWEIGQGLDYFFDLL